ncbi:bifunctional 2-polyprenyl-6-hydroxyphenol methylase/3-demethylubiquinol 3-O-methyltransferase UbiG [Paraburkholderia sp. DHOC27]|uniref:class I SAM-dependent methyltransferase n=1 Tax=Paraburkholderia sp. DHOC27 TaxID=2303330 RepID=UPI000E3D86FE|nr:class I SAM-dependent methyltransferase [Paraburkholderia sp. DHOC27]RFU49810.1 class I SAM-dependent methyltransferase [Paraburkholderia sp. DHOC27]
MTTPIPFVPNRFKDNAAHYLGGRAAYSPRLIRRVAETCKLDGTQRLLDLGCGPGQISLAFSTWIDKGVAIDPAPEMLTIASELGLGVAPNIEYRLGSSYDLSAELGRFQIAVIGRAFHWMDRPDTLARLDQLIDPSGAVVLFSTSHPDDPPRPWFTQYHALVESYAQTDPAREQRKDDAWESHESVLMNSPFASLERVSIVEVRRVAVESLLARVLSMSSLSRERLGSRLDELLERARALLEAHAQDGWLEERVDSVALIARR